MAYLGSYYAYPGSKTHSLGSNHVRLSFEKWQKTSKKGDRIKKTSMSLIIRLFLSFLMYVASKKTNIYSILLAFYLLEEDQNAVLRP